MSDAWSDFGASAGLGEDRVSRLAVQPDVREVSGLPTSMVRPVTAPGPIVTHAGDLLQRPTAPHDAGLEQPDVRMDIDKVFEYLKEIRSREKSELRPSTESEGSLPLQQDATSRLAVEPQEARGLRLIGKNHVTLGELPPEMTKPLREVVTINESGDLVFKDGRSFMDALRKLNEGMLDRKSVM